MSLNGLDTPDVRDAYQRTIAEAGGWFLLKYISRDSVELLGQGKSGVHEARNAIAKYEEPSPLYGLIIYRRRKVLIKFIPEGTSRLLQARTAVHFQDVMERYSPYETMLEITTADSLNDTSLASSFPLHTASPSTSSNRLHEISEDGEDHGPAAKRPSATHSYSAVGPMFGTQRYKSEKRVDQLMGGDRARRPTPSIQVTSDAGSSPASSPLASPQKTSLSQFLVRDESGQRSITSIGSQPSISTVTDYAGSDVSGKSAESAATTSEPSEANRPQVLSEVSQLPERLADRPSYTAQRLGTGLSERSVESARLPEIVSTSESVGRKMDDEPYDFSRFDVKPKVKLGPRPVAGSERAKRQVASIAAVPASFRPLQKKPEPVRQTRTLVNPAPVSSMPVLPRPPPIPDTPEYNPRPVSRGSVKSLPSHKSTTMTPDKIRLMKAVELRKKQLRKSNPQPATFVPPKDEDAPAVPVVPSQAYERAQETRTLHLREQPEPEAHMEDVQHTTTKKPDSGIEMHYDDHEQREQRQTARHDHVEKPRPPSADEGTLAQLQPPQRPEVTAQNIEEPTMSMDMLGYTPTPPTERADAFIARHQPDLRSVSPRQEGTLDIPMVATPAKADPVSPVSQRTQDTQDAVRIDDEPSNDTENDMTSSAMLEPPDASPRRNNSDLAKRRRGIVEPLHIDSQVEGDVGSDDELLEELQVATVHQAKPMTLARSPMAPSFQRRPSAQSFHSDKSGPSVRSINIRRSSSNLLERFENSPDRASPPPMPTMLPPHARSQSVVTPPYETADQSSLRRNASNGITKRVQALAEASSRETSPNPTTRAASPEAYPTSTWRERKSNVRSPPRSRTNSYKAAARQSGRISGWGTQANILQQAESSAQWSVQHDPSSNRDSVSVSARIVRPSAPAGDGEHAPTDGQFQQPQLMINHNRASATNQTMNMNKALPPINTESHSSRQESAALPLASSPIMTRGSSDTRTLHSSANRKSFGRYKQAMSPMTPSAEDFPAPPIQKTNSTNSLGSSNDDPASVQGGSRTSRFFKRMSNLGTKDRRRSGVQQSLGSMSNAPSTVDVLRNSSIQHDRSDMPPSVVVGDLNVQFPDSLLWKRRIVEIDDAGYLIFSIPQALDHQKGAIKRFHMSEFRMPSTPDLDRQELPHSVMLDFTDGQTTLQAACEDAMTHRQVLHTLRSYWKAWSGGV